MTFEPFQSLGGQALIDLFVVSPGSLREQQWVVPMVSGWGIYQMERVLREVVDSAPFLDPHFVLLQHKAASAGATMKSVFSGLGFLVPRGMIRGSTCQFRSKFCRIRHVPSEENKLRVEVRVRGPGA